MITYFSHGSVCETWFLTLLQGNVSKVFEPDQQQAPTPPPQSPIEYILGLFLRSKVVREWSWPFTSIKCWDLDYTVLLPCLPYDSMLWCWITGASLPFTLRTMCKSPLLQLRLYLSWGSIHFRRGEGGLNCQKYYGSFPLGSFT